MAKAAIGISEKRIAALLRSRPYLSELRFRGDTTASAVLSDLDEAIAAAGLTERQSEALRLVYYEGLTQADAAERMGIAQKNVSELLSRGLANIATYYEIEGGIAD